MSSLVSELTNPCSSTNLTAGWRKQYAKRRDKERQNKWARKYYESSSSSDSDSDSERNKRIYTPAFYAVQRQLEARWARYEQERLAAKAARKIDLCKLIRACFGR